MACAAAYSCVLPREQFVRRRADGVGPIGHTLEYPARTCRTRASPICALRQRPARRRDTWVSHVRWRQRWREERGRCAGSPHREWAWHSRGSLADSRYLGHSCALSLRWESLATQPRCALEYSRVGRVLRSYTFAVRSAVGGRRVLLCHSACVRCHRRPMRPYLMRVWCYGSAAALSRASTLHEHHDCRLST